MKQVSLTALSHATFAGLLNTRFRVRPTGREALELELIEATAKPSGAERAPAPVRSFSLVFTGPPDPFLPQRTYPFEHEKLGAFDLFIVPIGKVEKGFLYEAVFNSV